MNIFSDINQSFYYCYCTNTRVEGIVSIPDVLAESDTFLCNDLYDIGNTLGESLFDTLALAEKIFSKAKVENNYAVTKSLLHTCLPPTECRNDPQKAFLHRWLQSLGDTPSDVEDAAYYINLYQDFINQRINSNSDCRQDSYHHFCIEKYSRIIGADTVLLDLKHYFYETSRDESLENVLDITLNHFQLPRQAKEAIREKLNPYLDIPHEFYSKLLSWISEQGLGVDPIIAYRIYKLNNMNDLFSATMQEVINEKKRINLCAYCGKPFVPVNRSDEIYCSRSCPDGTALLCSDKAKAKKDKIHSVLEKSRKRYDVMRHSLEQKYGSDSPQYFAFLDDYGEYSQNLKDNKISPDEFLSWIDLLSPNQYK